MKRCKGCRRRRCSEVCRAKREIAAILKSLLKEKQQ